MLGRDPDTWSERGSEATERADSSDRRANLRYPNPLEGYTGLSSKAYQLGNGQTELENRAGLPRESEKAFFFPASVLRIMLLL